VYQEVGDVWIFDDEPIEDGLVLLVHALAARHVVHGVAQLHLDHGRLHPQLPKNGFDFPSDEKGLPTALVKM
jgi:hypothetical protein